MIVTYQDKFRDYDASCFADSPGPVQTVDLAGLPPESVAVMGEILSRLEFFESPENPYPLSSCPMTLADELIVILRKMGAA